MTSEEALNELCAAVRCYSFPPVTFDFREYPDGPYPDSPAVGRCIHDDMQAVERCIGALLRSSRRRDVWDGLSNVLYWGWAQGAAGFQRVKVRAFRDHVNDQLDGFRKLVPLILAESKHAGGHLHDLATLGLPQFSQASFTTKVLTFLDPRSFPVLDLKIARAFANRPEFPPLQGLTFGPAGIPLAPENLTCYTQFAAWTRETAKRANEAIRAGGAVGYPCRGLRLRAVDVERGLFTLSDWWKRDRALTLLVEHG